MARKENKGGRLTNEQVEQDLKAKGKASSQNEAYHGAQDNGDSIVRPQGDAVQRADGRPADTDQNGERE
ncbi:MAG TPA: hypothetical protein VFL47_13285 [Flavisolibacter sp.]|nr:hypothetical protein [Flavisolibacter sp.]